MVPTSFISDTRSSRAFIKLSCAETTTLLAKWFNGRNKHVTAKPTKHETPSKEYKKIAPTMSSMGESGYPSVPDTRSTGIKARNTYRTG